MKLRNKKTGEITDGAVWLETRLHKEPWHCASIADLEGHWEDYKEPLIKDEKIRKAVRAWAEAQGENQVQVTHCRKHILSIYGLTKENGNIDFDCYIEPFDEGYYTIDELCGEEE